MALHASGICRKTKVLYSVQHEEGSEGGIVSAAFSASGEVMVTVEQNSIARWAVDSGRLTGYWSWPKLTDVAVSATILDLKLDTNAKTLISESSTGIGQRWALN